MKTNLSFFFLLCCISFFSCKNDNTDQLKHEVEQKQRIIDSLKKESYKETDRNLFNEAVELMNKNKYKDAITKFKEMNVKYPNSELINESSKNIDICEQTLTVKGKQNEKEFSDIIKKVKTIDIEESIKLLEDFRNKDDISNELKEKVDQELNKYQEEYKKIEGERKFEKGYGIKFVKIDTYWSSDFYGSPKPVVKVKIKNVSGYDITWLKISVQFLDKKNGSIYAEQHEWFSSGIDVPFGNGLTKEGEIEGDKGLEKIIEIANLPFITAKIYIGSLEFKDNASKYKNILYKEVTVNRKFGR